MADSAPDRQRNPRGEGARLRERLVQAAIAVIDEVGDLSKVSVRAITRRADVSPTALYLHFADREELVDAAIDAGFAAFNAALLTRDETAEPRERLAAMGEAYLGFVERQPALYAVIFSSRRPRVAVRAERPSAASAVDRRASFDALVALVAACLDADDERAALETAIAVWSALHGYATLRASGVPGPWPSPDAFVQRTLGAFVVDVARPAADRGVA